MGQAFVAADKIDGDDTKVAAFRSLHKQPWEKISNENNQAIHDNVSVDCCPYKSILLENCSVF